MSEKVNATVLVNGQSYNGQADILGANYYVDYEPIKGMDGSIVGAYFSGNPTAESDKAFSEMRLVSILAAVAFWLIGVFIMARMTTSTIAKPIVEVAGLAVEMSRGNFDVADPTLKFRKDEMGKFADQLVKTKHQLNAYIADITHVILAMADGDFSQKPQIEYSGSFAVIGEAFGEIQKKLKGTIYQMNKASVEVMSGSEQIANVAQVLAEGTIQQAKAIEDITATLGSINERVRENAEKAHNARTLSNSVEERIVSQNDEMKHMLEAMDAIETESNEISKIIQNIDSIAFQTNIIALNAAIEAARAGAVGKGFAVVADEVRNLALKSAEAAKDTNKLINSSMVAVNNGTRIVTATASSMDEIMQISKETSTLITDIAETTNEQADAITRANESMDRINDVVNQNSASAEESAASCEELSAQAKKLQEQVGMLKA